MTFCVSVSMPWFDHLDTDFQLNCSDVPPQLSPPHQLLKVFGGLQTVTWQLWTELRRKAYHSYLFFWVHLCLSLPMCTLLVLYPLLWLLLRVCFVILSLTCGPPRRFTCGSVLPLEVFLEVSVHNIDNGWWMWLWGIEYFGLSGWVGGGLLSWAGEVLDYDWL